MYSALGLRNVIYSSWMVNVYTCLRWRIWLKIISITLKVPMLKIYYYAHVNLSHNTKSLNPNWSYIRGMHMGVNFYTFAIFKALINVIPSTQRVNVHRYPANTRHCRCAGSMLGQRRRRWPSIKPAQRQCLSSSELIAFSVVLSVWQSRATDRIYGW